MRLRLLTIGHSYCVRLNRQLANSMAQAGGDRWEVVTVAPRSYRGDYGRIRTQPQRDEASRIELVRIFLDWRGQIFLYGPELRRLMAERWDLIHVWEEPFTLAGSQIALWNPQGRPLVYSVFQNLNKRYPPPFGWIERLCMSRAAGWIALGETIAEVQKQRGFGALSHRVIPMGVDTELFHPDPSRGAVIREKLGWADSTVPVIGYLGRFVESKGIAMLMRAIEALSVPWRALFIGSGPLFDKIHRWAGRFPRQVRITLADHDQVPWYLNACDLLCVPSQTTRQWREQFGRVIIEAFASEVAVIGSNSGEIPKVIGEAGTVVSETDPHAWTSAIQTLLKNPAQRQQLASAGRRAAVEKYAWPQIARAHLAFFESIVCR